jgi:hypothetical protein
MFCDGCGAPVQLESVRGDESGVKAQGESAPATEPWSVPSALRKTMYCDLVH